MGIKELTEKAKDMTRDEAREISIAAGIIDSDGKLNPKMFSEETIKKFQEKQKNEN